MVLAGDVFGTDGGLDFAREEHEGVSLNEGVLVEEGELGVVDSYALGD